MKKLILCLPAFWLLAGCTQVRQENDTLTARIDSLHLVLAANDLTIAMIEEIGQYMDSVASDRHWIRFNLEADVQDTDPMEKLKNLEWYINKVEYTIEELEKARRMYALQVDCLRCELSEKDLHIRSLEADVADFQNENFELLNLVAVTEGEFARYLIKMDEELEMAQLRIQALLKRMQQTEAEVYYVKAEGKEEVAEQLRLAPKKKKQALKDAQVLYSVSSKMGYEPATDRLERFEAD